MATVDDKDLLAYFLTHYRENLASLLRKLGLGEEDSVSPFVRLHQKKAQVRELQKALVLKEEALMERMKDITCRWRDLHTKEAEMKTHTEKSGRIIQEDDNRRIHALTKAVKERERKVQTESELLRAKRELEALRNKHQKLCNKVQKYSIFKKYLEDVVKISEFEQIQEVISRYKTLVKKHKDLLQSQHGCKEMSETGRVLLDQYAAEREAEILQYKKEMLHLRRRSARVKIAAIHWGTSWAAIQKMMAEKAEKLGTMRVTIFHLFQRMNTQLNANLSVPVDDSHTQLDMIELFIHNLQDICMEARQNNMWEGQQATRLGSIRDMPA